MVSEDRQLLQQKGHRAHGLGFYPHTRTLVQWKFCTQDGWQRFEGTTGEQVSPKGDKGS